MSNIGVICLLQCKVLLEEGLSHTIKYFQYWMAKSVVTSSDL